MNKLTALKAICIVILFSPLYILSSQGQNSDDEQGDLIFIISDNISPSNFAEYELWIKEFKTLADETGAPAYGVSENNEGMSFFMNVGKTMAGYDNLNKKFEEWFKNNPKVMELEKKYGHTRNFGQTYLWRHNPSQSYVPEGYDNTLERTYTRVSNDWIKTGHTEEAKEIIAEFKAAWTKADISARTNTYWNVFGREQACVAFVTSYESREAWVASRKEVMEKVGEAKLNELQSKWNSILRKQDEFESFGRPDLAHTNE